MFKISNEDLGKTKIAATAFSQYQMGRFGDDNDEIKSKMISIYGDDHYTKYSNDISETLIKYHAYMAGLNPYQGLDPVREDNIGIELSAVPAYSMNDKENLLINSLDSKPIETNVYEKSIHFKFDADAIVSRRGLENHFQTKVILAHGSDAVVLGCYVERK